MPANSFSIIAPFIPSPIPLLSYPHLMMNRRCKTIAFSQVVDLTEEMGYVEFDLKKNTHAAVTWVASKAAVVRANPH
jgi:hypothetical protein